MALVDVPCITLPEEIFPRPSIGTPTSVTMDAVGEGIALICYPTKAGPIRKIYWYANGSFSLTGTLRGGIYAVDAATGLPNTASPFGGMVAGTVSNPSAGGASVQTITLGTDCTIGSGDLATPIAVVIDISARTSGSVLPRYASASGAVAFPYPAQNVSTWAKLSSSVAMIAVEYSDGSASYIPGSLWLESSETISTTGVNERGTKFILPFGGRAVGVRMVFGAGAPQDGTICLYNSADGLLASIPIDKDVVQANYSNGVFTGLFASPQTLTAGTYRLTYLAGSSTGVTVNTLAPPNATFAKQALGDNFYAAIFGTSRTGAGAWSDVSTVFRGFYLKFDKIDLGGGGAIPGVGGLIR